jgi:hypothetical protein
MSIVRLLFGYPDEQAFRFNHQRDMKHADPFSMAVTGIVGRRLMYADLIGPANAGFDPL